MLKLTFDDVKGFDEETMRFVDIPGFSVELEHSLLAVAAWESKWKKAFFGSREKTQEEILDYINEMQVGTDYNLIPHLDSESLHYISEYIKDPNSATVLSGGSNEQGRDTVTAELIYYWMSQSGLGKEYETWNVNRLVTLIRVISEKNNPKKTTPKSRQSQIAEMSRINAERRAAMGSRG